jgi:hypothetical protein
MATTIDNFRHYLNPLHIMCRLIDLRVNAKVARRVVRWYEVKIYNKTCLRS